MVVHVFPEKLCPPCTFFLQICSLPCKLRTWEDSNQYTSIAAVFLTMYLLSVLQRFKCFGELDAPDWILAEISVLSRISSVRMKLIVSQVINSLKGQPMDYAKVAKLTSDAGFEASEIKAAVAALENVLVNAAKYNCDDVVLENELQQLGLPREHTVSLCRPYKEQKESLRESLARKTLKLPGLDSVKWRAEATLGSSVCKDLTAASAHFQVGTDGKEIVFEVSEEKLRVLHHELVAARALLESSGA